MKHNVKSSLDQFLKLALKDLDSGILICYSMFVIEMKEAQC